MVRKFKGVGIAAAVVALGAILGPVQGASAADGCGDGWFKQSDGYLTKSVQWQGLGAHNAWIYHTGRVRFCTEDDTFNNDENRRALIGYPSDSYPFQSEVDKNSAFTRFCVQQTVEAHLTGITTSSGWGIEGTVSKGDPGVTFTYSSSSESGTVSVARNAVCGADVARLFARVSGFSITAQNESGKVEWVHLATTINPQYMYKGTKNGDTFGLSEYDYS
jgi:hypothetical protein